MIPRSKRNKSFKQKAYNPSIVLKTGVKKINGKVVETCDYDKNALEPRRHLELSDSTKSLTNGKTKEVMSNANASIPSTERRFIPDDHLLKGFEVQKITATRKIVVERWSAEANEYVKEEIVEYRVRWKGFADDTNDTWVESKFISNNCIDEYRRWLGFLATAAYDLTLRNVLLESAELKMMIEKNILTQQSSNHPNLRIYLEKTSPSTHESPGPEEIKAAKPFHRTHHSYHRGAKQWRKQNLVGILLSIVLKKDVKKGHTHDLWTKYGGNDKNYITFLQIASFCSNRGQRSRDRFGPFMSTLLMRIFFFKLSTDDYGNAYLRKKDTTIDKDNDGAVNIARIMEENHPSGRNSVRVSVKDDDGVVEADLIAEGVMALKRIYWECGGSRLKLKNPEGAETVENIAFKEKILRAAGVGCRPLASFITASPSKRILSLNMSGCGVVCKSFPDAIGNLIFLEDLDLSNNKGMRGRIPEAIGRLTNLKTIKFQDCFSLTGSIPTNFCRLLKLRIMDFQNCGGIDGELPQYLGDLEFLQVISFVGCYRLTGAIPPKVGTLKYLKYFGIAHCQKLTGKIPDALGTVSTLEILNAQGCKNLHGTLPLCLCGPSLEFSKIKYVDFSGCTSLDTSGMACERDVYRKILDDPC